MASLLIKNISDLLARELKLRAAANGRTAAEEHQAILEAALTAPTPDKLQRELVAQRLNRLRHLITEGRGGPKFDVPEMAEMLGMPRTTELEAYFRGDEEAPFEVLQRIAETFGARPGWLKFGKSSPFDPFVHSRLDRGGLARFLDDIRPERVFMVRCRDDEVGSAAVFVQRSTYRFEGVNGFWHISSQVGATGAADLVALWGSLVELGAGSRSPWDLRGRDLPPRLFEALIQGEIWPGTVLLDRQYQSYWFHDFIDCHHLLPIADGGKGYAQYGQPFLDAQAIVRSSVPLAKAETAMQRTS